MPVSAMRFLVRGSRISLITTVRSSTCAISCTHLMLMSDSSHDDASASSPPLETGYKSRGSESRTPGERGCLLAWMSRMSSSVASERLSMSVMLASLPSLVLARMSTLSKRSRGSISRCLRFTASPTRCSSVRLLRLCGSMPPMRSRSSRSSSSTSEKIQSSDPGLTKSSRTWMRSSMSRRQPQKRTFSDAGMLSKRASPPEGGRSAGRPSRS
mmetsp:Transcript_15708/g.49356  ORF Transcript_15708/g.49356 Transcript_15708/m.49356 type:complete len:213 (+) Transcript_15708:297-935(+)